MAAYGTGGRGMIAPLLIINLSLYGMVLGLAAWSIDKYIDGQQHHHHLGGNAATTYMLMFALIGGVIGLSAVLAGTLHFWKWRNESLASASSPGIISCSLTALAFGVACKEIAVGGHRGRRLQTLEVLLLISTLMQLVYLMFLQSGMCSSRYGPACYDTEPSAGYGAAARSHEAMNASTSASPGVAV